MTLGDTARARLLIRVRRGILASGIGFVMRLFLQMVQVPLFLSFWGVSYYGEWILLFTTVGFLGLLDFGFCSSGGNDMARYVSNRDIGQARQVFTVVVTVVGGSILVFSLLGPVMWGFAGHLLASRFSVITPGAVEASLGLLMLSAWSQLVISALGTVLRGVGQYAEQTILGTILAFAELCAIALSLVLGGGAVLVAAFILASRILVVVIAFNMSWRTGRFLFKFDFSNFISRFRSLSVPSLSFFLFPVTNVISLQGVSSIVGLLLGPVALAELNMLRTLARFVDIIPDLLVGIVTSEAAYAHGRSDKVALQDMSAIATLAVTLIALGSSFFLFFFADWIFGTWTRGQVSFGAAVFLILLAARSLRAAYLPSTSIVVGMNNHARLGVYSLTTHILAMGGLFILVPAGSGLVGVALTLLFIEVVLFFLVFSEMTRISEESIAQIMVKVVSPSTMTGLLRLMERIVQLDTVVRK